MYAKERSDAAPTLSLILPAWNESEVIRQAIDEADSALSQLTSDYEIIVVDDGSTDGTGQLVLQAAESNPHVRLVQHSPNQGYGASIRSGFAAAEKELVVFTDADCQFDLTELDRFVLLADRYDIVCGYRIDRKDTPLRCLYSRVYNQMVRILLRTEVRDVDCALKMFHREVVQNLEISGGGFLVNSEILTRAKQAGYQIVEVGVSHRPRTEGTSTVSISHIPKVLCSLARFWWNAVQFPVLNESSASVNRTSHSQAAAVQDRRYVWASVALMVIAAVFMLTNLGYPLIDRDETRYAEIPREMIATGNWVLPQLNFQTYYDKPPLVYWLCAISFKLFGITETAARLVPALAALATIASTMWFGARIFDKRIGLLSGVVLLLSAGFAFTSRYLLLDGVMTLFVSLSLFTAYEAIRSGKVKLGWWLLAAVFCGLGFLTKGPVALVLWLPPVFAFAWLSNTFAKPRWWQYGMIGGVTLAIAMPWMIAVSLQDASFLTEFFYTHNLGRFAGGFHNQPIWYFVPVLLIAGHPWSFLTIPYAHFLFRQSGESRYQRPAAVGYLLLWSVWCFVFFSLSRCKLPTYLLPAAPAFALMIGHYLDYVLDESADKAQFWFARFWSPRTATVTTCGVGIAFVIYITTYVGDTSTLIYAWATLWTVLLGGSLFLLIGKRHDTRFAWPASMGTAMLLAVMVMHQWVPMYSQGETLFGQASPLSEQIALQSNPAIATVAHEFSGVPFYLKRSDVANFGGLDDRRLRELVAANQRTVLVVEKRIPSKQVERYFPPGTRVRRLGNRGQAQVIEVVNPTAIAKRLESNRGSVAR
ncbi:glycosyltransferase [Novipirellula sp. SH528]|uniref:glycosyltransferase n=1 Tax=Novipirellula sp. SH528 TaxID=3454466 RepID=UPI003FA0DC11